MNYDMALKYIEKAIELDPLEEMCYRLKGRILESTNFFEEALKAYDASLHLNPSCCYLLLDRADVLRKLG